MRQKDLITTASVLMGIVVIVIILDSFGVRILYDVTPNSHYVTNLANQNTREVGIRKPVRDQSRMIGDVTTNLHDVTNDVDREGKKHDIRKSNRGQRSIPKILHQIWNDEYLPTDFVENVKGLTRDNPHPEWKYYFWTKSAGLKFIQDKYPFLYEKANGTHNMLRSDLFRYLVIYEYGGVYFDLDTVSVKPLTNFLTSHTCALAKEPRENFPGKRDLLIASAALLCVRKHPFFTHIVLHLATVLTDDCQRAVLCTGPMLLTTLYEQLNKTGNYAGPLPSLQESEVFQDFYDVKLQTRRLERRCTNMTSLTPAQVTTCNNWIARGKDNRTLSERALTYHTWYHIKPNQLHKFKTVHIKDVVPHAKMYGKDF